MANIFSNIKLGKYQEIELDINLSPFEVFKRIYSRSNNVFLLESLGEEGKYNRFSYIGFDPEINISAFDKQLIVDGRSMVVENPLAKLRQDFKTLKIRINRQGYAGGLVGFVSYEGTKYVEPAFDGFLNSDFPDFEFGFYLDGLRFDKKGKKCVYFHFGQSRFSQVLKLVNSRGKLGSFHYKRLNGGKSEEEHKKMVEIAKEHIKAGDIFQAVLSLKSHYQVLGDLRKIYAVLRRINPAPYMIYFKFGEREILSASPELLVRVKRNRIEHFGTLAGTIKRGKDKTEDRILAERLIADEKEMAEHMMLVDLARNDIGKISRFGSITVDKLATVKTYQYVQHLYSEIRGKLKTMEDCFSALMACFPAGTLSGAPKIEAMKIIKNLEGSPRGPYGGVGGYISFNKESMFAILIRSLFIKAGYAYTQTGSGIVFDSIAAKEYQEIVNKQKGTEKTLMEATI